MTYEGISRFFSEMSADRVIGLISVVLALFAILYAWLQTKDMRAIQTSLSTRFLGDFPHFVPEIVKVLERAKHSIIIVCDFPTYGLYSAPDFWSAYRSVLDEKMRAGIKVKVICLEPGIRDQVSRSQFFDNPSPAKWGTYRKDARNLEKIRNFLIHCGRSGEELSISLNEFFALLEQQDQETWDTLFQRRAEEHHLTSSQMPLYFWISDKQQGVFAFPTYTTPEKTEYGFITADQKLIDSFLQVYTNYARTALAHPAPSGP
jgi:hypothetical protein